MSSRHHLLSLPLEIREEIYFHLLMLIVSRQGYAYNRIIHRHVLNRVGLRWITDGDPFDSARDSLSHILTVSHQVNAEVQSVLYRRFSLYFSPRYIRHRLIGDVHERPRTANWGMVRNLVWQCFVFPSAHHDEDISHLMTRREVKRLMESLPGLTRVDVILCRSPTYLRPVDKAMIGLAEAFTHVPEMTVYLEKKLDKLKEKIERMNTDRTLKFQLKIFDSFPSKKIKK